MTLKLKVLLLHPNPRSVLAGRRSRIPMDHYNYPNVDNAASFVEAGRLGRNCKPAPGARRDGLYTVVQQTG